MSSERKRANTVCSGIRIDKKKNKKTTNFFGMVCLFFFVSTKMIKMIRIRKKSEIFAQSLIRRWKSNESLKRLPNKICVDYSTFSSKFKFGFVSDMHSRWKQIQLKCSKRAVCCLLFVSLDGKLKRCLFVNKISLLSACLIAFVLRWTCNNVSSTTFEISNIHVRAWKYRVYSNR